MNIYEYFQFWNTAPIFTPTNHFLWFGVGNYFVQKDRYSNKTYFWQILKDVVRTLRLLSLLFFLFLVMVHLQGSSCFSSSSSSFPLRFINPQSTFRWVMMYLEVHNTVLSLKVLADFIPPCLLFMRWTWWTFLRFYVYYIRIRCRRENKCLFIDEFYLIIIINDIISWTLPFIRFYRY